MGAGQGRPLQVPFLAEGLSWLEASGVRVELQEAWPWAWVAVGML